MKMMHEEGHTRSAHQMALRGVSYRAYVPRGNIVIVKPSRARAIGRDNHFSLQERPTVELTTGATRLVFEHDERITPWCLRGDAKAANSSFLVNSLFFMKLHHK